MGHNSVADLQDVFSECGATHSVKISGQGKAIVTFADRDAAGIYIYVYICVCVCVCMCVCVCVCVCECVFARARGCGCAYVCLCVHECTCMQIYTSHVYICVYFTYIHIYISNRLVTSSARSLKSTYIYSNRDIQM